MKGTSLHLRSILFPILSQRAFTCSHHQLFLWSITPISLRIAADRWEREREAVAEYDFREELVWATRIDNRLFSRLCRRHQHVTASPPPNTGRCNWLNAAPQPPFLSSFLPPFIIPTLSTFVMCVLWESEMTYSVSTSMMKAFNGDFYSRARQIPSLYSHHTLLKLLFCRRSVNESIIFVSSIGSFSCLH